MATRAGRGSSSWSITAPKTFSGPICRLIDAGKAAFASVYGDYCANVRRLMPENRRWPKIAEPSTPGAGLIGAGVFPRRKAPRCFRDPSRPIWLPMRPAARDDKRLAKSSASQDVFDQPKSKGQGLRKTTGQVFCQETGPWLGHATCLWSAKEDGRHGGQDHGRPDA